MEELVFITRVHAKNFVGDFLENLKNIIGGRLKQYEKMVNNAMTETWTEFKEKYPDAKNIRVDTEQFTEGAVMITITGFLNVE